VLRAHQRESLGSRYAARRGYAKYQNGARRQGFTSSRLRAPLPAARRLAAFDPATGGSGGNPIRSREIVTQKIDQGLRSEN